MAPTQKGTLIVTTDRIMFVDTTFRGWVVGGAPGVANRPRPKTDRGTRQAGASAGRRDSPRHAHTSVSAKSNAGLRSNSHSSTCSSAVVDVGGMPYIEHRSLVPIVCPTSESEEAALPLVTGPALTILVSAETK